MKVKKLFEDTKSLNQRIEYLKSSIREKEERIRNAKSGKEKVYSSEQIEQLQDELIDDKENLKNLQQKQFG